MDLLRKMKPTESGSNNEGILDALHNITDKMKKEFDAKIEKLETRVLALEDETKRQAEVESRQNQQLKKLDASSTNHEGRLKALEEDQRQIKLNMVSQEEFEKALQDI